MREDCRENAALVGVPPDECLCRDVGSAGAGGSDCASSGGPKNRATGIDEVTKALLKGQTALLEALANKPNKQSSQRHVKVPVLGSIPKVTKQDLGDIDGYLREFDRTCRQIAGGPDLPLDEKFLFCCSHGRKVEKLVTPCAWSSDSLNTLRLRRRAITHFATKL